MPSHVYFQLCRDEQKRQSWRWELRDQNEEVLAVSPQIYGTKSQCLVSISLVKDSAFTAPVYDEDGKVLPES